MGISNRRELIWLIIAATLIVGWGSIPTWTGRFAETQDLRFRGLYFDTQDYAVHIAMMEAGMRSEWAYQFRFTTEPVQPAFVRMFYIGLGHLSRLLGLGAEPAFHLARWLLGYGALFALYVLMRSIFRGLLWARAGFLLAAMGSGLGWLQLLLDWSPGPITPIDFWLIDAYVFFGLSLFPHFAFVTTAMCIALKSWIEYLQTPSRRNLVTIILAAILVQLINPIAFAAVDAALLGAAVFAWRRTGRVVSQHAAALGVLALTQMPLLLYNVYVLANTPYWSQFAVQNHTPSPPPTYYLWGFGLLWLMAGVGAVRALRDKNAYAGAAILWIVAAFLLAYAPVLIQRRFLHGITIPFAILAVDGLRSIFESKSPRAGILRRQKKSLVILIVFLAAHSSIQLAPGQALHVASRREGLFYPASLDPAADWLRHHAAYGDVVLAAEATSQVLAQRAGVRVYHGHEMETLHYALKGQQVAAFFDGRSPQIASPPVVWVLYGPEERRLWPDFRPPDNLFLANDHLGVQIYGVR